MSAAWLTASVALTVAVCGGLTWAARHAWHIVRRITHFLDDYAGQPARDGMPARPGLMARLASVEESLAHVVTETTPNGGGSMRDTVMRIAADVAVIKTEQTAVRDRLELQQSRHGEGQ